MIAGNNEKHIEHIRFLANQARDEKKGYYHSEIGFNYRMTNLEAALGLAQMERLEIFAKKKKRFNNIYRRELGSVGGIRFQKESSGAKSSFWMTCIICETGIRIEKLISK